MVKEAAFPTPLMPHGRLQSYISNDSSLRVHEILLVETLDLDEPAFHINQLVNRRNPHSIVSILNFSC